MKRATKPAKEIGGTYAKVLRFMKREEQSHNMCNRGQTPMNIIHGCLNIHGCLFKIPMNIIHGYLFPVIGK